MIHIEIVPWRLIPQHQGRPRRSWWGWNYELRNPWRPRVFQSWRIWRIVCTQYAPPTAPRGEGA